MTCRRAARRRSVGGPVAATVLALAMAFPAIASAGPPALPSSFWGDVTLADGSPCAEGLVVSARVGDGVRFDALTRRYDDRTVYTLHVPADDEDPDTPPGGREGDAVLWEVCGHSVGAVGAWHGGTNQRLDLRLPAGVDCASAAPNTAPPATAAGDSGATLVTSRSANAPAAAPTVSATEAPAEPGDRTGDALVPGLVLVAALVAGGTWASIQRRARGA